MFSRPALTSVHAVTRFLILPLHTPLQLLSACEAGHILCASTCGDDGRCRANGLVPNHAYALTRVVEVMGGGGRGTEAETTLIANPIPHPILARR